MICDHFSECQISKLKKMDDLVAYVAFINMFLVNKPEFDGS